MRRALSCWESITKNKTILSWIKFGVPPEFRTPPVPYQGEEYHLAKDMRLIRDKELLRFQELGVITDVLQDVVAEAVFCGIFVTVRKDKCRPIIDQRYLNSFAEKVHFKMDTIRDVRDLLREKDLMFSIDLKDAYLHLKYRSNWWKYNAFWWNGQPKMFTALMFGNVHGPRWWTKVMKVAVQFLRKQGIRCVIYLDDLLVFCGSNMKTALDILNFVFSLLLNLGLTINIDKSLLKPVKVLPYLGFIINSKDMTFSLEKEKMDAFKRDCKRLTKRGTASARDLARVLGKISSMSAALLPWRLRTRATLISKNQALRATGNWDKQITLDERVIRELQFWLTSIQEWNGKSIREIEPDWTLTSDSSGIGFGGHSSKTSVAHFWEPEWQGRHSTILETLAAHRVIKEIIEIEELKDGTLLHQSDNTTAVAYLNNQGGRIPEISEITEETWNLCLERGIVLRAQYVPGETIEKADFLSRIKNKSSELSLNQKDFDKITKEWGTPSVDLFSTRFNHKVERFVTLFPDPLAIAEDAFSMRWEEEKLLYAFPPFNQIGRILSKMRREPSEMILITPKWEGATWMPDLKELSDSESPLPLNYPLIDLEGKEVLPKWKLLAWKLSKRT